MSMKLSRERAAQAWCKPTTKHKEMDADLAEAFAEILEEVWSKSWLGNATTKQLLDELYARFNLNYRTVDEDPLEKFQYVYSNTGEISASDTICQLVAVSEK